MKGHPLTQVVLTIPVACGPPATISNASGVKGHPLTQVVLTKTYLLPQASVMSAIPGLVNFPDCIGNKLTVPRFSCLLKKGWPSHKDNDEREREKK